VRSIIIICMVLAVSSCAGIKAGGPGGPGGEEPQIRVLLDEGKTEYRVTSSGALVVTASGIRIAEAPTAASVTVKVVGSSLNLTIEPGGQLVAAEGEVTLTPKSDSVLGYGGVRYAGTMRFVGTELRTVALVNVLPLESYLQGVLPHEIGNPGPDGYDAIETQAIAARTYAIGKMAERRGTYFDVYATVLDQVYGGLKGQNRLASGAISDTRGRVVERGGNMVRAYYSACCGGHTSDIRLMWPQKAPADYLYGVLDRDPRNNQSFCKDARYFRWRYSFTGKELGKILRTTIPKEIGVSAEDVGALLDLNIDERSASGRVVKLTVITTRNSYTFAGDRIRWILMRDVSRGLILPSAMFRLDKVMEGDAAAFVSISGGGNGHGVGMCQNGAIAMARRGYDYEMILAHYYPGCTVVQRY
jgi:stage II sporulation protein D